jgi:RNA polymerase sigma-70 factor (ECF subfamily)
VSGERRAPGSGPVPAPAPAAPAAPAAPTDRELVDAARAGRCDAFETLMRRHNRSLFRLCRSLLGDEAEAEDVAQDAWVRAYRHLGQYAGEGAFATWLLHIAKHEALARLRRRRRQAPLPEGAESVLRWEDLGRAAPPSPEERASSGELGRLLEEAVDSLGDGYRAVFVLRDVEGLSTPETAALLDLSVPNVKVRLHRARAALRGELERRLGDEVRSLWSFDGARCDRLTAAVWHRLDEEGREPA